MKEPAVIKKQASVSELLKEINGKPCPCGKPHTFPVDHVITGRGAVRRLPEFIGKYGAKKAFLLADGRTYRVAGETVRALAEEAGCDCLPCLLAGERPEPDERAVGGAAMRFEPDCDLIIGVGSGVVNDTGKILSSITGRPYILVATAPSMDGFASRTSSMSLDGLKVTLPSRAADVVIGDTDILATAPDLMLQAGLGDMIAKYVSICEWRISRLVTGEYYCERVAGMIRAAVKRCVDNADGLLSRDGEAIEAVFTGLTVGGIAMNYAGISRPASGGEHYISHIWDMRSAEFGTPSSLHGIQCGIATVLVLKLYEQLKRITPDREKALDHAKAFDYGQWSGVLRRFLGRAADSMIENEKKEKKYDLRNHAARLEAILTHWDGILRIIDEELPESGQVQRLLEKIHAPASPEEIGIDRDTLPLSFYASKDMRAKYVLSMLAWDLGVLGELRV